MLNAKTVVTVLVVSFVAMTLVSLPRTQALTAQTPDADLIYVPVMVRDSKNVPITTLKESDFQILEDNKAQETVYFSAAGEPITLHIILGLSARGPVRSPGQRDRATVDILNAVERVREAGAAPVEVEQIPLDSDEIFNVVTRRIEALSNHANPRKALVVVSDGLISSGMQASSARSPRSLVDSSKILNFPIYLLTVTRPGPGGRGGGAYLEGTDYNTGYFLEQIAQFSGGEARYGQFEVDLAGVAAKLRDDLRNQYVIGYQSPNPQKNGKWRKISVKVNPSAGKVKIDAKERYFVAKN